ncbi:hypothetical protein BJV78DRAFT_83896 [Lactifluus subvellereus]|nr:hypothetical protein BJV78DRAFT_83896 [Lactifluus subvellereus]
MLFVRMASRVIPEKLAVWQVIWVSLKPSVVPHTHALGRSRHGLVRRYDERIPLFLGTLVVLRERAKLARVHPHRHLGHGQPAEFDQPEERLAAQQPMVFLRVSHAPVSSDECWQGVEDLGRFARVRHRLVDEVAQFDALGQEVAMRSSAVILVGSTSGAISVGAGEGGCKARHAVTLGMRCFGAPVTPNPFLFSTCILGPHTSPLYLTSQIRSLHYHHSSCLCLSHNIVNTP